MKKISTQLFAKITAGFDGDIYYIRITKRCLIAWYTPKKDVA